MNSDQVPTATLAQVLCSSVRIDNAQALCDRYCDLTGMTTWVVWNKTQHGSDRLTLMDQGQMNCLRLQCDSAGSVYGVVYCSDQPGRWLIKPVVLDPPLAYGHVRQT